VEEVEDDVGEVPKEYKPPFISLEVPWLLERAPRTLMIRQCYAPLLLQVLSDLRNGDVLLSGSGGTGKTQFQAVLFKALVGKKVPVVLDLENDQFFFVNKDREVEQGERGKSFIAALKSRDTVYLYDARPLPGGDPKSTLRPLDVEAATCVTASPSRGGLALLGWKEKRNTRIVPERFMPPWDLKELLALRDGVPEYKEVKTEDVQELFTLWGGNVRHTVVQLVPKPVSEPLAAAFACVPTTVDSSIDNEKRRLQNAIITCDSKVLLEYLRTQAALSDKLDLLSHSLLTLVPSKDFRSFSYAFCSDHVRDKVLAKESFAALVQSFVVHVRLCLLCVTDRCVFVFVGQLQSPAGAEHRCGFRCYPRAGVRGARPPQLRKAFRCRDREAAEVGRQCGRLHFYTSDTHKAARLQRSRRNRRQ
jgi:hypothetical protein